MHISYSPIIFVIVKHLNITNIMKPEEIKLGTKFKYIGYLYHQHKDIIQTVTKIDNNVIYSDCKESNFHFYIDSIYMNECVVVQSPNNIKPELYNNNGDKVNLDEYLKNNLKLHIHLGKKYYWDETQLSVNCSLHIGDMEITTTQSSIDI